MRAHGTNGGNCTMSKSVYTDTQQREILRVIPELIRARELLIDLVWKDLRVRYRYALMGFLWAVLEPLLMTLILTFVFSMVLRANVSRYDITTGSHYAAFILVGLIPWQFISTSLTMATRSLVDGGNLVQKVYFPREIIPLAVVGNALVNFLIGFVLLFILFSLLVHVSVLGALLMLGMFIVEVVLVIGLALLLACAHVFYRDVGYIVEVATLFGFYATPVFYAPEHVKDHFPVLYRVYMLNPMAALVTCYRDLLWYGRLLEPSLLVGPIVFALLALAVGAWWFRRNAPQFSDNL